MKGLSATTIEHSCHQTSSRPSVAPPSRSASRFRQSPWTSVAISTGKKIWSASRTKEAAAAAVLVIGLRHLAQISGAMHLRQAAVLQAVPAVVECRSEPPPSCGPASALSFLRHDLIKAVDFFFFFFPDYVKILRFFVKNIFLKLCLSFWLHDFMEFRHIW